METEPISVLICEDSEVVRTGISYTLKQDGRFVVVGHARDGSSAVELAGSLKPHVVLMDVLMPEMDGIEATRRIKQENPQMKVLILTSVSDEETALAALGAGADSFCLKQSPLFHILQAVMATAAGACWLDSEIAMYALRRNAREGTVSGQNTARFGEKDIRFRMSAREFEVLSLLVEGLSNKQISEKLYLSVETVKTHMRHILEKLQVSDRTQAAIKALREGLVGRSAATTSKFSGIAADSPSANGW